MKFQFSYDLGNQSIHLVISKYALQDVAGCGTQIMQILNLMNCLRNSVAYNGMTAVHPE